MKDSTRAFLQESVHEFQSRNRDARDAAFDAAWRDGYESAAEVCLDVLAKHIDNLQKGLGNLPKDEQVALSKLYEVQRATKRELAGGPWDTPVETRSEDPRTRTT